MVLCTYLIFLLFSKSCRSQYLNNFYDTMRVTPSLPQRGRHPKGSIPLTPIYISPVSRGISHYSYEVSSLFFRDATSILGVPLQVRLMTKSAKSILAPPCLGEALRRGTLPEIDNFTNFHDSGSDLWFIMVSPEQFFKTSPLCSGYFFYPRSWRVPAPVQSRTP